MEVTEERVDADPDMQPTLEEWLTRLEDMWVIWAEFEAHPDNMLDQLLNQFSDLASVWETPT
ncbi:MAG: hypothetical protein ACKPKO_23970 [Candidatus Fonsibacter sp.]